MQRILEPGQIESLDRTAIPRLRMPNRAEVFSARAQRLRQLADGHPLSAYLRLMAVLVGAQQTVLDRLPAPALDAASIASAQQHCMPLVPATGGFDAMRWQPLLVQLIDIVAAQPDLPVPVREVLAQLRTADSVPLEAAAQALLAGHGKGVDAASAPFLMAALQVLWTAVAASFDAKDVPMMDVPNICPVCGTLPVASVVRIGGANDGYRYLACGLCATEWHMVRVKCTHCESTEHVSYHIVDRDAPAGEPTTHVHGVASADRAGLTGVDADAGKHVGLDDSARRVAASPIRAESCDDCQGYRKIFYQDKDPFVEPVADDLASLALDVLMGEAGYARANGNPLLWQVSEE